MDCDRYPLLPGEIDDGEHLVVGREERVDERVEFYPPEPPYLHGVLDQGQRPFVVWVRPHVSHEPLRVVPHRPSDQLVVGSEEHGLLNVRRVHLCKKLLRGAGDICPAPETPDVRVGIDDFGLTRQPISPRSQARCSLTSTLGGSENARGGGRRPSSCDSDTRPRRWRQG